MCKKIHRQTLKRVTYGYGDNMIKKYINNTFITVSTVKKRINNAWQTANSVKRYNNGAWVNALEKIELSWTGVNDGYSYEIDFSDGNSNWTFTSSNFHFTSNTFYLSAGDTVYTYWGHTNGSGLLDLRKAGTAQTANSFGLNGDTFTVPTSGNYYFYFAGGHEQGTGFGITSIKVNGTQVLF